ncbi:MULTISPECIES: nucleotide exchange factor GrpE [unclassified Luteimonas]|uniref:nucleotide exchange factor GrpE n=1 Tax=unclassified Luteimonas TaxID=2629088 RepID=UPI0016003BB0|nr:MULTISPECIES: nucleotide exchange factor GrpE [unclassified Luteimonas]MBB1471938.1 nucleotide exchange factor GrpE [Luteimonas sp. MC1782]MBB6599333.1 nucleotide exchange factor GrpE [Luteimonas sp. MC1825]QOC87046.1 nucleotide exchange factor GrpE [Luteimonas sp. MC1825]
MTNEQTPDDTLEAADTIPHDELEALRGELEQLRAQSLVERADLDNQRKRLQRDVQNACRFANKQLLGDLLPVFDSLDAALLAGAADDPMRTGMELTLRELLRVTASQGLVQLAPAPGDAFNPDQHQAMSVVDAAGVPAGAVAQLFQKGYQLNEQLLRPALVAVARDD